jgi:hypothetical protein
MTPTVIRFLCHSFGDSPAHDDSLHLSTGFRHGSFSRHAWHLEKPPPAYPLLAHFHAGHSSRTQNFTGHGQVDTGFHHGVALFSAAQSQLLGVAGVIGGFFTVVEVAKIISFWSGFRALRIYCKINDCI